MLIKSIPVFDLTNTNSEPSFKELQQYFGCLLLFQLKRFFVLTYIICASYVAERTTELFFLESFFVYIKQKQLIFARDHNIVRKI